MADEQPKKNLKTRYFLIASLALNVLLVGLIGGAILKGPPHKGKEMRNSGAVNMLRALPADRRSEMRAKFEEARSNWKDRRKEGRALGNELRQAIAAKDFDRELVLEIVRKQQLMRGSVAENTNLIWLDVISSMSLEERKAYAEQLSVRSKKR